MSRARNDNEIEADGGNISSTVVLFPDISSWKFK